MRRVLAAFAMLTLGAAILLPVASAAPPVPGHGPGASQRAEPSQIAEPSHRAAPSHPARPSHRPRPSQVAEPSLVAEPSEVAEPSQVAEPNVIPAEIDDGNLRIVETVVGAPTDFTASFGIEVWCDEDDPVQEAIAFPDPGTVLVAGLEAGAVCYVAESERPDAPAGYQWDDWRWEISGNPATIVSGETVTVTIVNRLTLIGGPNLYVDKGILVDDEEWTDQFLAPTGSTVTFEIWMYNAGGVTLHDVTIDDDLVDVTGTECATVPDLKPDQDFVCHYTDVVETGTTVNTASVDSAETGPETGNATVVGYTEWPLALTKISDAPLNVLDLPTAQEGDSVTFTITYEYAVDLGTSAWLWDVLPDGFTYVPGSATGNAELVFEGVETWYEDEDDDEGEVALLWYADTLTTDGSVTYRVMVDRGANQRPQPLTNAAGLDVGFDVEGPRDSAIVYVAQSIKGETSPPRDQPTAPPTDTVDSMDAHARSGSMQLPLVLLGGICLAVLVLAPTPATKAKDRDR